ncbi:sirohydrochlorin chelatase [Streptomyces sp. NPDC059582]|uniref:sirohydrochlorin chelatase n=1 Tax=Streptomyces sp. NPDC059582 TaxID=3346875 RepID=UPI0036B0F2F1
MTASLSFFDESDHRRSGGLPPGGAHLDSAAHLMNRIGSQLAGQLSRVSLDGRRRPAPPELVLAAHGSRDPRAAATVRTLLDRVRELRPGLPVHLGHIGLNEPLLSDTLAALRCDEAVLVPLLLGHGGPVERDITESAAGARVRTRVADPLGPHPLLVEALYERLVESGWRTRLSEAERRGSGVVLAAAGPRDPESAAGTRATARLLAERLGVPVVPAYACAATPDVRTAVRAMIARGRHRVAVAAYFTTPGGSATRSAEAAPWLASAPLGAHPALARLILHRYDHTPTTSTPTAPKLTTA